MKTSERNRILKQSGLIATLLLSSCNLSPATTGYERGGYQAPFQQCGEAPKETLWAYKQTTGNAELKCALAESTELQREYYVDINRSSTTRNTAFALISASAAMLAAGGIESSLGPENFERPATILATGWFLSSNGNRLFNGLDGERRNLKAIASVGCAQDLVAPYNLRDGEYDRLVAIIRGNGTANSTIFARNSEAVRALSAYANAAKRAPSVVPSADAEEIADGNLKIQQATKAGEWGRAYLANAERVAPDTLLKIIRNIQHAYAYEAVENSVRAEDIEKLFELAPIFIQESTKRFVPGAQEDEAAKGAAIVQSRRRKNPEIATQSLDELSAARAAWLRAKGDLHEYTLEISALSKAVAIDFARLSESDKCKFDVAPPAVTLAQSTLEFTKGTPIQRKPFNTVGGESPFKADPIVLGNGLTIDFNEATGNGTVSYDGKGEPGEYFVTVSEPLKSSRDPAALRILISESTDAPDNGNSSAVTQSKPRSPENERVVSLQRVLNSKLSTQLPENGIFDQRTLSSLNAYRARFLGKSETSNSSIGDIYRLEQDTFVLVIDDAIADAANNIAFNRARSDERRLTQAMSASERKLVFNALWYNAHTQGAGSSYPLIYPSVAFRRTVARYQYEWSVVNSEIKINGFLDQATYYQLQSELGLRP